MRDPLSAGAAAGGLFAPPAPPPQALNANAAIVMQIAKRMPVAKTAS
jgi:hypothetical protein